MSNRESRGVGGRTLFVRRLLRKGSVRKNQMRTQATQTSLGKGLQVEHSKSRGPEVEAPWAARTTKEASVPGSG